jgi:hypothetical protein
VGVGEGESLGGGGAGLSLPPPHADSSTAAAVTGATNKRARFINESPGLVPAHRRRCKGTLCGINFDIEPGAAELQAREAKRVDATCQAIAGSP